MCFITILRIKLKQFILNCFQIYECNFNLVLLVSAFAEKELCFTRGYCAGDWAALSTLPLSCVLAFFSLLFQDKFY